MSRFQTLLADVPLLGDGGMGTALIDAGLDAESCLDALNLDQPAFVEHIHRMFAHAGARFVETNTFGANRFRLRRHSREHDAVKINRAGVEIAKRVGVLVAGSVGPLGVYLAPYGRVKQADAREAYLEQISALEGVDFLLIETQSDLREISVAVEAAGEALDVPIAVCASFTREDRTLLGSTPEQVASRLVDLGVDAIGVNCSEGPSQVLRVMRQMIPFAAGLPLVAIPNAGGPQRVGQRIVYPANAEYFGDFAREFAALGGSIIAGCCGTGADHVQAMAGALGETRRPRIDVEGSSPDPRAVEITGGRSHLSAKLAAGNFVVAVEMNPPSGPATQRLLAGAETLAEAGADVVYVTDSPASRLSMSPWAVCRLVTEHTGVESVLGFPVRGRSMLRLQSDLLGAHALGIRNLFVIMGNPEAGNVMRADIVPTGLMDLVTHGLNHGRDASGSDLAEATHFVVGCAVDLAPAELHRECRLLHRKINSGASFALSQPVFDPEVPQRFRSAYEQRYGPLHLPILAGVVVMAHTRNCEYLHNELPGITVPASVRDRMRAAGESGGEAEGLGIALEVAAALKAEAAGIYVLPQLNRYHTAAEVVESLR